VPPVVPTLSQIRAAWTRDSGVRIAERGDENARWSGFDVAERRTAPCGPDVRVERAVQARSTPVRDPTNT